MRVLVYESTQGHLVEVAAVSPYYRGDDHEGELRRTVAAVVPADAVGLAVVEERELPDRRWRAALRVRNGSLGVDMAKARAMLRDRLRTERAARFQHLDIDFQKAWIANDRPAAQRVESRRQQLRDAPGHPSIERAETLDDLDAITLDGIIGGAS